MKAADPKYCRGRIMAIKKGVNHSNNKERCSAGNLYDLLWKYCKSRYADLSCSDVHWNFWRICNALRLGSEVWPIPASYFTNLEKKEHKCLKKSTVFILHFVPSLRFTLSLQSAFYSQSAFYHACWKLTVFHKNSLQLLYQCHSLVSDSWTEDCTCTVVHYA